jgi:hypothetical protein
MFAVARSLADTLEVVEVRDSDDRVTLVVMGRGLEYNWTRRR